MKLGETAKKVFESTYLEKLIPIRESHDHEMKKTSLMTRMSVVIDDEPQMIEVSPKTRFNLYVSQVKQYAKDIINARIEAFIEVHKKIGVCPDSEDVADFKRELGDMARSFIDMIKPAYENPLAPYTTPELKEQILQALDQELQTYPGIFIHRLDKFVYESLLLKERGLPIGSNSNSVTTNVVNVSGDLNGSVQVGTNKSSQTVTGIQQVKPSKLSKEKHKGRSDSTINESKKRSFNGDKEFLTEEEMKAFLESAKHGQHGVRDYLMMLMIYRHGLRVSELVGLRLDDLDLEINRLYIRRNNGGRSMHHPIEEDELSALRAWLSERSQHRDTKSSFLFLGERGALKRQAINYLVGEIGKRAKLHFHINPHMLRHSTGNYLVSRGYDTRLVQEYLGHRNIVNNLRYAKTSDTNFEGLWR